MTNLNISVSTENASAISRKLTIKIPAAVVKTRFESGLARVAKTAKLRGSRPGFVPMPMVKQVYGNDVRHHLFHELIDEGFREAVTKEKLKAVGQPQIDTPDHNTGTGEHDHQLDENKDLTFIATVEVLPELEVKSYAGLAVSRPSDAVTDADLQKTVNDILGSQASLTPVADEAYKVKKGDFADVDFDGGLVTDSGIERQDGMKGTRLIEIGSDQFIEGFEENIVGMKKGETKTFRVPFPKDYFEKSLAGKESEFTVKVNEIKEKVLPKLDDEFAKQVGYDTVAELKAKAREQLEGEKKADADRKVRSDLLQELIAKNKFDVPQSLIQAQTRTLAQDVANNLKNQGFSDAMIQEALMGEMESLKSRAENQVRASLLLEAISKKEKIEVEPKDVDAEIANMAKNMKMDEERIREFYHSNPRRRDDLNFRMLEEKTMKFLLDKAKVKNEK